MFIDRVKIYVKAGDGGNGAISFRREKYVPNGGPDGGDGGRGGNIIFRVNPGDNTLLAFRYHRKFVAENGGNGMGGKKHGKNGEDVIITVPQGTLLKDPETNRIIFDMAEADTYVVCRGGRGGWGNRHFATPTRQIPRFAKNGTKGEERELLLELKMLADVALIGYPSVGKSSLLSKISAARPKIADYHFTTLSPNLGVVSLGEGKGFVAADIPGLIEGAADGQGLGHEFLRHTDRCRLLLHVVDIASVEGRDPKEDLDMIDRELARWNPDLATRPQIVVANKYDVMPQDSPYLEPFVEHVKSLNRELFFISAATGEGVKELIARVGEVLETLPPLTVYASEITPEEQAQKGMAGEKITTITVKDGVYYVEGQWLLNFMGQINFDDYESMQFFQRVLQKNGVFDRLREAGIQDGDIVNLYDFEFEFVN
ncbi:MAG: GTPase ObgE [Clostridia bacterium]|nr:GTPase ObgE [Clostridia bacterium]